MCGTASDCAADEFCSERAACGVRCDKPEGCAGEPCLGDEACADHEYCASGASGEVCAVRCADAGGCPDQPCAGDLSCGTDEYCSKAKRCAPRCSDELGCAGPELLRGHQDRAFQPPSWPIVSDGQQVYYHRRYASSTDDEKRPNEDPKDVLTAWDLQGEVQDLFTYNRAIYRLDVRDGIAYMFLADPLSDDYLARRQVSGSAASPQTSPALEAGLEALWFTDEAVWWSKRESSDSDAPKELWRASRTGDFTPVGIAGAERGRWLAGNESVALRGVDGDLIQDTLPDLTPSQSIGTYWSADYNPWWSPNGDWSRAVVLVDGQALFVTQGADGTALVRIMLDSSSATAPVAAAEQPTRNVFLAGDWVYWGAELEAGLASINRRPRDLSSEPEELLRGDLDPTLFTVTADSLVYFDGERFFVMPLP
jgi:hypothetical protein